MTKYSAFSFSTIFILALVLVLFMLFVFSKQKRISSYTDLPSARIDEYGKKLASWCNANHTALKINNLSINEEGPNAGGYSQVVWIPTKHEKNLKSLLESSSCNPRDLDSFFSSLKSTTSQSVLMQKLSCLGEVKLTKVTFSSD